jgi:hypothetical protein
MNLQSRLERAERRLAARFASRPTICPACGNPPPSRLQPYLRGEGWSDLNDACTACLPEDPLVITLEGATERPAL